MTGSLVTGQDGRRPSRLGACTEVMGPGTSPQTVRIIETSERSVFGNTIRATFFFRSGSWKYIYCLLAHVNFLILRVTVITRKCLSATFLPHAETTSSIVYARL